MIKCINESLISSFFGPKCIAANSNQYPFFSEEGSSEGCKTDLMRELDLMKILPDHPNVVKLLGFCIEKGDRGIVNLQN